MALDELLVEGVETRGRLAIGQRPGRLSEEARQEGARLRRQRRAAGEAATVADKTVGGGVVAAVTGTKTPEQAAADVAAKLVEILKSGGYIK